MDAAPTAPARLRSPGELAAVLPHLTGFVPHESLLVVGLRGGRRRVGVTLRADLRHAPALVDDMAGAVTRDGARAAVLAVVTEAASDADHPYAVLVDAAEAALLRHGVPLEQALLVRSGRWWSYRCDRSCCPGTGTRVVYTADGVLTTAAQAAYDGQVVLASRDELVASLRPHLPLGPALVGRLQAQALAAMRPPAGELARWRTTLDRWEEQPVALAPAETAALVAALHQTPVRDAVASWAPGRSAALLSLLGQLCRASTAPHDAPLCSVLGAVAYAAGNGALALVALQRALATDPTYSYARLLLAALDGQLPPAQVRHVLRRAA